MSHLVHPETGKEVHALREEREDPELTKHLADRHLGLRDDSILVQPPPSAYFRAERAQPMWPHASMFIESEHYGGPAARGCWGEGSGSRWSYPVHRWWVIPRILTSTHHDATITAIMRTTLTIDDDMMRAARSLAGARAVSVGRVVSDLMRLGIERSNARGVVKGFPTFAVPPGAKPITLEDVKRLEDEG